MLLGDKVITRGVVRGRGRILDISSLRRTLRLASGRSVGSRRGVLGNVVQFNSRATGRIVAAHRGVISLSVHDACPRILGYVMRGGCDHVPMCRSGASGVHNILCVGSLLPRLSGTSGFH